MKHTVTRLFDTRAQAESAVAALEAGGIPASDLSIVAGGKSAEDTRASARDPAHENEAEEGAEKGAATGGLIGGGAGLLAGLGLLAIPGIGPVVAAGWLAATAVGAAVGATAGGATGGLLGALKESGVPDEDAHVYAEGVRRGGTLVSARVDDSQVPGVEDMLSRASGVDATTRGAAYREAGWKGFDPTAPRFA